jgi:hypothetical protein
MSQRTVQQIKKDIQETRLSMRGMADMREGVSGQGKGIFLDNCARKLQGLAAELRAAKPRSKR